MVARPVCTLMVRISVNCPLQNLLFTALNQVKYQDLMLWCRLAKPLDIITFKPAFQPWRDLENELLNVFDRNSYSIIVTPEDLMDDDDTLANSVVKNGST